MISIVIPTYNNLKYLKLCIESLAKNSSHFHEIVFHINDGSDGTLEYIKENNFKYTFSDNNIGLCSAINKAVKITTSKFILYAHDDMYFCPHWDNFLFDEIKRYDHDKFYLSGTMIEPYSGHITFNCGNEIDDFQEKKLLDNIDKLEYYDHQGTHFAPHLVSRNMWDIVGGFSEEFNPGIGSDPDFNMKLWKNGVRIFKGLNKFRVYHFGSLTTRKKANFKQNRGDRTFLKKWKISVKFFKKYYLRSKSKYFGPLDEPNKNFQYFFDLFICKIKSIF